MGLKLFTVPATEPVTLTEAKAFLRIGDTDEDTLITSLIAAAREKAEQYTDRAFITQTWDLTMDAFPAKVELPKPPLQSVTGIYYTPDGGTEQTLALTAYLVDATSEPARVVPQHTDWPQGLQTINGARVRFVAGYGAASAVPSAIKQAILLTVGFWYENRKAEEMPEGAKVLLAPYRVLRV